LRGSGDCFKRAFDPDCGKAQHSGFAAERKNRLQGKAEPRSGVVFRKAVF
jgi:hypothetical protein